MLIVEKTEIKITGNNLSHYTAKGYKNINLGDVIAVGPTDFPIYSERSIDLICDRCGVQMKWMAGVCARNMAEWNGHYCRECKKIIRTGYPTLSGKYEEWFRSHLKQWKEDSLRVCSNRCLITGEISNLVHHTYPLRKIIFETFNSFEVKKIKKNIFNYSLHDRNLLAKRCLKLHYEHGLGACITKELHFEFHHIYGTDNFTPEQFEEFKTNKRKELTQCQLTR